MSQPPQKQHIAHTLLTRAHSPQTSTSIFHDRIKTKPLLLRPSSPADRQPSSAKEPNDNRKLRRKARDAKNKRQSRKPKPLSAKQKRALCLYEIPVEQRRYDIYVPLNRLWCGYVREILGLQPRKEEGSGNLGAGAGVGVAERRAYITAAGAGPMLVSADYHGAEVEVVRSRCVSRVGIKGIVVKDTKFTFEIITVKNKVKTVPKEHSVFRFSVPLPPPKSGEDGMDQPEVPQPLIFEIHGSQFEARAQDRANKKFRQHIDPDL